MSPGFGPRQKAVLGLLRAARQGVTVREVIEVTGVDERRARRILNRFRDLDMVVITHDPGGAMRGWTPMHRRNHEFEEGYREDQLRRVGAVRCEECGHLNEPRRVK